MTEGVTITFLVLLPILFVVTNSFKQDKNCQATKELNLWGDYFVEHLRDFYDQNFNLDYCRKSFLLSMCLSRSYYGSGN